MNDIKLAICIPTAGMVPMGFAYSLAGMISRVSAAGIPSMPEASIELAMDIVESSVIHTNREQLVKRAIDSGKTHILFLDDDMIFEPFVLELMFGRRQPVVCTNYLIKTEPAKDASFVAVGLDGERVSTKEHNTGLQPIAYSGFGVSLFETKVFAETPQPWFMPHFVPESNSYTTEDNPCYERIRNAGYQVYLDHDASKLVSHIGRKAWNWKEKQNG